MQAVQNLALPDTVIVFQTEAVWLAHHLQQIIHLRTQLRQQIQRLLDAHPDYPIFASLPGTGPFLAAGLLVKFRDDRQRFPTPASVQALAVTRSSGKKRSVRFRCSCDHQFRHICQQFARTSLHHSVWAQAYWQSIRPRCASQAHAYRCLANRWLAIIWKMWQTGQPYDQSYHLQQCALRRKPLKS